MVYINGEKESGILFVDDEPILCELVNRMLEDRPYHVFTATTPEEGLSLLDENLMDLVISDYKMKQMDGLEFLQNVYKKQPAADRIIVTGYCRMEVFIDAIKGGRISRIMHKPWDRNEFLKVVDESVRRQREKVRRSDEENRYKRYALEMEQRVEDRTRELGLLIDTLHNRNEKLEKMHHHLMHSDKMASLGVLAGTVMEDIVSPVTAIKGNLDILKTRNNLTSGDYALLEKVIDQADYIEKLVRGISDFSEYSSKSFQPVNLLECLEEATVGTQHLLSENEIELLTSFPDEEPLIYGDPVRITQIYLNLLQRAAQAMPDGGKIRCQVKVGLLENRIGTTDAWEISITDSGMEIPHDRLEHMFEMFHPDNAANGGLRLKICKHLVQAHDGTIDVESTPEKGTTFRFLLPKYTTDREFEKGNSATKK